MTPPGRELSRQAFLRRVVRTVFHAMAFAAAAGASATAPTELPASVQQMQAGLKTDGRIALHGLQFDTGKSEITPDSRPQLEEMAKPLKAGAGPRVFSVGHTDDQGAVDGDLTLSRRRAEAAALATEHGIDARRLSARIDADFAPAASNADDAVRARNRRVDLVVQSVLPAPQGGRPASAGLLVVAPASGREAARPQLV